MDANQRGLTFESEDMQMPPRWFPVTPAKLGSTRPQPICSESNNQLYHDQWLQSEDLTQANQMGVAGEGGIGPTSLPETFLQGNTAACDDLTNAQNFSTWVKALADGDDNISRNDEDVWRNNVSFAELLAIVDAAGTTAAAENGSPTAAFNTTSSTFSRNFHPETGSSQFATSENGRTTHGANFPVEHNSELYAPKDGGCVLSKLSFDFNCPPRTADATSSKAFSLQIEPITPKKITRAADMLGSTMPNLSIYETPSKNRVNLGEPYQDKEYLLAVDQLSESTSRQLEENHRSDEGTKQQKPRGKKHRPEVIIEGQIQVAPERRVGRPSHPQETTKGKRKYVRRKGVDNPTTLTSLQRETNRIDITTKPPSSKGTIPIKRKYVRRIGVNKAAASILDEGNCEKTDTEAVQHASNSRGRSLIFDFEGQDRDESLLHYQSPNVDRESHAQNFSTKDRFGSFMQYGRGKEATKAEGSIDYDLTHSMKQVTEDYPSTPEGLSSTHSPHTMTDTLDNKYTLVDKNVCTRGKCQIVVSDSTHDKEGNAEQVIVDHTVKSTGPSDSYSSSNTCLMHERQERGLKRRYMGTNGEEEFCNSSGIFHNSLQSFHDIFSKNAYQDCQLQGMCFPSMYKTKRIEKEHISVRSSTHHPDIASESRVVKGVDDMQKGHKKFKLQFALGPKEGLENVIFQATAPVCHLASSPEIFGQLAASPSTRATSSKTEEGLDVIQHQHKERCKSPTQVSKAPTADSRAPMMRQKQAKKYLLLNSTVPNTHNNHQFTSRSTGPPLAITWRSMSPVEVMIEQFKQLDLNEKSSQDVAQMHNAYAAYHMNYREQHALIPCESDGALVPFDRSFDPVKRSRPQPKIDLADETKVVWKLLLDDINSRRIKGTDEEKAKWGKERRVFQGRADSFIARMHLVQGDRLFSPWEGSVGVFLTRNVSVHLSSSAFMSHAARFLLQSKRNPGKSSQQKLSITFSEPEVYDQDTYDTFGWNKVSNKPTSSKDSKMHQDTDYNNIIEEAYSFKSFGNSCIGTTCVSERFLQGKAVACDDLTNDQNFDTCVDVAVKSVTDCDYYISRSDEDMWRNNGSFGELVALKDAAGTNAAAESASARAAFDAASVVPNKDHLSKLKGHSSTCFSDTNKDGFKDSNVSTRGKCQNEASDTSQVKEGNPVLLIKNLDPQSYFRAMLPKIAYYYRDCTPDMYFPSTYKTENQNRKQLL